LRDLRDQLERVPTEAIELHCALIRSDALRAAGGLDTRLGSSMDCVDLAFRMQRQGTIWFEPDAVAGYDDSPPALRDLPLYLDRWSTAQIDRDIERFVEVWQLDPDDPRIEEHRFWLNRRRWTFLRGARRAVRQRLGPRPVHAAKQVAEAVNGALFRHRAPR
jgi:hypothetical protein